ncbi:hypothetical protein KEM56_004380, partial [Ascosphaera pollenicola]
MDGDISPMRSFVEVLKSLFPYGNAYVIVDEAHATGVFGRNGVGIVQDLGLEDHIFIRIHTFGKALASHGAIVLCSPETREYLVNYCRAIIFTTAMGFPLLAAIRTSYEILSEGLATPSFDTGLVQMDHVAGSPIFSIRSPFPRELAAACQAQGYIVRAIMSPTVPAGKERVRVCLHAGNTKEQIDGLVETLA